MILCLLLDEQASPAPVLHLLTMQRHDACAPNGTLRSS